MPNQPILRNNGWLTIPFAAVTGKGAGNDGIDGALGHGPSGNQTTFVIQVAFGDVGQAIQDILGVYYSLGNAAANSGVGWVTRKCPVLHPLPAYQGFVASRIVGIKPMVFTGKVQYGGVPGLIPGAAWNNYRYALLSILFQQPKYAIYDDATLDAIAPPYQVGGMGAFYRQEWIRFTEWHPTSTTETISREGGSSFKWIEGGGGTQPTSGNAFPVPWYQVLGKVDIEVIWRQVPLYNGIFLNTGAPTFQATNLDNALMKVNANTFMGRPAGTLLLRGYKLSYNEAPYPPSTIGLTNRDGAYLPPLTADISIALQYFSPPGKITTGTHNHAPWTDGFFYQIADFETSTKKIYGSTDFEKIFSMLV